MSRPQPTTVPIAVAVPESSQASVDQPGTPNATDNDLVIDNCKAFVCKYCHYWIYLKVICFIKNN